MHFFFVATTTHNIIIIFLFQQPLLPSSPPPPLLLLLIIIYFYFFSLFFGWFSSRIRDLVWGYLSRHQPHKIGLVRKWCKTLFAHRIKNPPLYFCWWCCCWSVYFFSSSNSLTFTKRFRFFSFLLNFFLLSCSIEPKQILNHNHNHNPKC